MRRLWVAVLALGFVAAVAKPALALSCPSPETAVATMDVIAAGRVVAVPAGRVVHLSVQRYYKGYGPALLIARLRGITGSNEWIHRPAVGDELLIGFTGQGETLVNYPCHVYMRLRGGSLPDALAERLGPGREPVPGTTSPAPWRWWDGLLVAAVPAAVLVGAVAILGTFAFVRHRSRRHA